MGDVVVSDPPDGAAWSLRGGAKLLPTERSGMQMLESALLAELAIAFVGIMGPWLWATASEASTGERTDLGRQIFDAVPTYIMIFFVLPVVFWAVLLGDIKWLRANLAPHLSEMGGALQRHGYSAFQVLLEVCLVAAALCVIVEGATWTAGSSFQNIMITDLRKQFSTIGVSLLRIWTMLAAALQKRQTTQLFHILHRGRLETRRCNFAPIREQHGSYLL